METPTKVTSDSEGTEYAGSSGGRAPPPTTGGKSVTGDGSAPLDKLVSLLEDIFEAEDSISTDNAAPPDKEMADFFSAMTDDWTRPLLSQSVIRKLTKNLGQVARPTRRLRLSSRDARMNTPRGKGGLAEVETLSLSRVLKLLERSVREGEDLDPFQGPPAGVQQASPVKKPAEKGKKKSVKKKGARAASPTGAGKRNRSHSMTPKDSDDEKEEQPVEEAKELTNIDLDKLERTLERAKESVLAADCCVALLSVDLLPKQVSKALVMLGSALNCAGKLYSEELITSCLATIKNQLTKIVYPFVEATSDVHGMISLCSSFPPS